MFDKHSTSDQPAHPNGTAPLDHALPDDLTDTETRILEAARTVFLRRGTEGARMRRIAEEAGVNQALLHYHFDDKATLAEAVFVREARDLLPPVLRVLGSERPIEEKVERVVELELDQLAANPFLPGYLLTELHGQPGRARILIEAVTGEPPEAFVPGILERLGRQLDRGAERGRLRPVEPRQFVVDLLSLCIFPFAAAPMIREAFDLDDEAFAAFVAERKRTLPDLFLDGIRT